MVSISISGALYSSGAALGETRRKMTKTMTPAMSSPKNPKIRAKGNEGKAGRRLGLLGGSELFDGSDRRGRQLGKVAARDVDFGGEVVLRGNVFLGDVDGEPVLARGLVGGGIVDPAVERGNIGVVNHDGRPVHQRISHLLRLGDIGRQLDGQDEGHDLLANGQTPLDGRPGQHPVFHPVNLRHVQSTLHPVVHLDGVLPARLGAQPEGSGVETAALAGQAHGRLLAVVLEVGVQDAVAGIERAHGGDLVPGLALQERQAVLDVEVSVLQDHHLGIHLGDGGWPLSPDHRGDESEDDDKQEAETNRLFHGAPAFLATLELTI